MLQISEKIFSHQVGETFFYDCRLRQWTIVTMKRTRDLVERESERLQKYQRTDLEQVTARIDEGAFIYSEIQERDADIKRDRAVLKKITEHKQRIEKMYQMYTDYLVARIENNTTKNSVALKQLSTELTLTKMVSTLV